MSPHARIQPISNRKTASGSDDEHSESCVESIATPTGNDELLARISLLETENRKLKGSQEVEVKYETIYFIREEYQTEPAAYMDEPVWAIGPKGSVVLKAHFPIHDAEGYIQQKQDTDFIIGKFYSTNEQIGDVQKASREKNKLPQPKASSETIRLETEEMREAFEAFVTGNPKLKDEFFPSFDPENPLPAPYIFWYHHRSANAFDGLSAIHRKHMIALTGWIDQNYGAMYALVDQQLERKVISYQSVVFLFKPGDAMIVNGKPSQEDKFLHGRVADSYPNSRTPQKIFGDDIESRWRSQSGDKKKKYSWRWDLLTWSYRYDGSFFKDKRLIQIVMEANELEEEVDIQKLSAYPLKYASERTKVLLKTRGENFWSCREKRLVSYEDKEGIYGTAERFMVDFSTYRQLHSGEYSFKREYGSIDNPEVSRMDASTMESDEPPPVPEIYIFPDTIPAFNLRNKKWVDLEVDMIREVSWNKQSFAHLVIDSDTKELVQALITNQIAREQGTDIIESKGNGLIILLHGGPGTGKTFTAESVAELAEKPLFRVTCGDIGTKPEQVEQYLESVLHLSKIWGCVVLLDEADVFLEQRELTDLERNALVSVFLRVLEYYEGILILTSNRVGTFDEAFKSRIQLSLHYENLTKGQRFKIWKNFLNRLREMAKEIDFQIAEAKAGSRKKKDLAPIGIDFDDVECYLSELSRVEMNGRQIRNAITTARQLAMFKKETMNYTHLKHVINVSSKFDTYLTKLREGLTDDQIARDNNVR